MASQQSSDVKFDIGHVLFIDIVGYAKLLITEQSERLQTVPGKLKAARIAAAARRKRAAFRWLSVGVVSLLADAR
jgi:hypothetical protein